MEQYVTDRHEEKSLGGKYDYFFYSFHYINIYLLILVLTRKQDMTEKSNLITVGPSFS